MNEHTLHRPSKVQPEPILKEDVCEIFIFWKVEDYDFDLESENAEDLIGP